MQQHVLRTMIQDTNKLVLHGASSVSLKVSIRKSNDLIYKYRVSRSLMLYPVFHTVCWVIRHILMFTTDYSAYLTKA